MSWKASPARPSLLDSSLGATRYSSFDSHPPDAFRTLQWWRHEGRARVSRNSSREDGLPCVGAGKVS